MSYLWAMHRSAAIEVNVLPVGHRFAALEADVLPVGHRFAALEVNVLPMGHRFAALETFVSPVGHRGGFKLTKWIVMTVLKTLRVDQPINLGGGEGNSAAHVPCRHQLDHQLTLPCII